MSPTMETKIHEVNERLRQKYIHVDNEWLSGYVVHQLFLNKSYLIFA